jgi:hypothetical protein
LITGSNSITGQHFNCHFTFKLLLWRFLCNFIDRVFMPRKDIAGLWFWSQIVQVGICDGLLEVISSIWDSLVIGCAIQKMYFSTENLSAQNVHSIQTWRQVWLVWQVWLFPPFFLSYYCDLFLSYTTVIEAEGSRFPPDHRWTPQINRCKFFERRIESAEVSKSSSRLWTPAQWVSNFAYQTAAEVSKFSSQLRTLDQQV